MRSDRINAFKHYNNAIQCTAIAKTCQLTEMTKTTTLNLRIDPPLKEALREAALREHRSIANMVEVLILRHCEQEGITIPEQHSLFEADE